MNFQIVFFVALCVTSSHSKPTENSTNKDTIYRLSDIVIPISYVLKIAPDFQKPIYNGSVNISVKTNKPTNVIELHSKELNVTKHEVTDGNKIINSKIRSDPTKDLLVIELQRELQAERTYTVSINFQGYLVEKKKKGFIKRSYKVKNTKKSVAFTDFEPTDARSAFPCFDEPKYKANFKIYIERDINQTVISNMLLQHTTNSSANNRVWDEFETSPPMSTYFVGFTISEFAHTDALNRSVVLWAREDAKDEFKYALRQGVRCLEQIEKMVSISYPLQKLDIAAIPNFRNYMENWGLNTFDERYIRAKENPNNREKKPTVQIECHVIAGMWFGDLITPAWWDYLWLKEGFGTYYEYFAVKEIEPTFRADEWFIVETVQMALWMDKRVDRTLTKKVETKSQLEGLYDDVTSGKGAAVIRMLEHILSPAVFRKFTNDFLITGRDELDASVTQDDFLNVLQEIVKTYKTSLPSNITISQIMKSWTENSGFPLITVTRDSNSQTATITQTTYKSRRARVPLPDQKWIVPLTYTTSSSSQFTNTTPTLWSLPGKPLKINVSSGNWVFCNLLESGYYRVNYDTNNWELLIGQLLIYHQQIPPTSRAQLIDDAFTLADNGMISYLIPLQISLYLPKETDSIPWYTAEIHMYHILLKFSLSNMNTFLKQYIQLIIKNQYQLLGTKPKPDDDMSTRLIRPKILQLACAAELPACIENALDEYKIHKDDISKLHPDLKQTVFQTALRHADDLPEVQRELLSLYDDTDDEFDRKAILTAAVYEGTRTFLKKILMRTNEEQIMEKIKKPRTFDFLTVSKISLAYLQYKYGELHNVSRLETEDILLIETLLAKIDPGIQTDELLNLLQNLQITLAKSTNKYASVIESIDQLYATSLKISREIPYTANKLKSILMDIIVTYRDKILFKSN